MALRRGFRHVSTLRNFGMIGCFIVITYFSLFGAQVTPSVVPHKGLWTTLTPSLYSNNDRGTAKKLLLKLSTPTFVANKAQHEGQRQKADHGSGQERCEVQAIDNAMNKHVQLLTVTSTAGALPMKKKPPGTLWKNSLKSNTCCVACGCCRFSIT